MSKFAIGDRVNRTIHDHEGGVVIAVFPTDDGNFRYAVDMEGYGALEFLTEEKLVHHTCERETQREQNMSLECSVASRLDRADS
jgi:hypothetical protein